jgi:alpha-ketoglutarate-dependent taurine dioxygenase
MFESNETRSYIYPSQETGLLIIEASKSINPSQWVKENKKNLDIMLLKFGGVLLRNFDIHSISEFNNFSLAFSQNLLDYIYRSTPRTNLGGKIYTATEYPSHLSIPLHNENSYSDNWPRRIIFFCAISALEGGQTPIADSRKVYQRIDESIRKKFEEKGILYVRNYRPGLDLDWREVFQTSNKDEVEKYCREHSIDYIWDTQDSELRTMQICPAFLDHPETRERVWFNQAHLFHFSTIEQETGFSFLDELGEANLPRNTYYGDGEAIEKEALETIKDAYHKEEIVFNWQRGDLMILDNVLMAHGRKPYSGERKIAVSMF